MLAVLYISTAAAFADSAVIKIDADKTEARPGDEISFSITLGPVSDMGTMQMIIVIPEGLTYVSGSGSLAEGLKSTLGFDYADFTESSMMVNGVASKADYSSSDETLLCTFSCIADEGFSGTVEVGLRKLEFYSCQDWKDHTDEFSVSEAVIKIGEDEVPAGMDTPGNDDPEEQTQPDDDIDSVSPEIDDLEDQIEPEGNKDPVSPDNEDNTEQVQPQDSSDPVPDNSNEETPSGTQPSDIEPEDAIPDDVTPEEQKSEDKTTEDSNSQESENTSQKQTDSDGQSSSDPDSESKNNSSEKSEDPPKPDSQNSQEPNRESRNTSLLWTTCLAVAAIIGTILAFVFKRKKTNS